MRFLLSKTHILAILMLNIPISAQAGKSHNVIDVKFIPEAVNNPKYVGGDCYDERVNCSIGKIYNSDIRKFDNPYLRDRWIRVKTNGKTVRVMMENLYAYLGVYCTVNFESYLAGDLCGRRRPQGPSAAPAPSIDP